MSFDLSFEVVGLPGTKGSARAFVRGKRAIVVNDAGDKARVWASQVADAARAAMGGRAPLSGPVSLSVEYRLPRPKSHLRPVTKTRQTVTLRGDAPRLAATKPDGDKLERCLWDALTGIVFMDDAQIVFWEGIKKYATDDAPVGALIRVKG